MDDQKLLLISSFCNQDCGKTRKMKTLILLDASILVSALLILMWCEMAAMEGFQTKEDKAISTGQLMDTGETKPDSLNQAVHVGNKLEDAPTLAGYSDGQNVMEKVDRRKRALTHVANVLMGGTIYTVTVEGDATTTLKAIRDAVMAMDINQGLNIYTCDMVFFNQAGNQLADSALIIGSGINANTVIALMKP